MEDDFVVDLYNSIKANTYICECCKEIVFPLVIRDEKEGEYIVSKYVNEIRGGKGNGILHKNICEKCRAKMSLFKHD